MNLESTLSFVLNGLWRASWQASVLAVVVLLAQRLFTKRLGGRGRFILWSVVLVRLLLPVLPQSRLSLFNLVHTSTNRDAVVPQPVVERPVVTSSAQNTLPIIVISPQQNAKSQANPAAISPHVTVPGSREIRWSVWIFAAWIAGVLTLAIRIVHVCWGLSRTIRKLEPVPDPRLIQMLHSCADTLRLRTIPQFLHGEQVQTPAVVGLFRPKLLVPSHVLVACEDREIRLILLHELAHLKRHDIASNWLIALASVLHWFNPIVWLASARHARGSRAGV